MASITIKDLARVLKKPAEQLLDKFAEAGVEYKSEDDVVSDEEKMLLVQYMRKVAAGDIDNVDKVRLKRKSVSQLKGSSKSPRVVNVEVRKKRSYIKKKAKTAPEPDEETSKQVEETIEVETPPAKQDLSSPETAESASVAEQEEIPVVTQPDKPELEVSEMPPEIGFPPAKPPEADKRAKVAKRKELHVKSEKRGKRKFKRKATSPGRVVTAHKHEFEKPTAPVKREVEIFDNMMVKDLAQGMAIKSAELVKNMMTMGMNVTLNQTLDQDTAVLIVEELGHTVKQVGGMDLEKKLLPEREMGKDIQPRAPVVTVMGHVDHGKTSLLDHIRKTMVTASESGGITQHIGAYRVNVGSKELTFLDTPGHAAFTAMRARGAQVTDIVVLVVAVDDSVMPQTQEAIEHAQAAGVPVIVAINKIDKPDTDPEKVKGDLSKYGIIPESWGGDNICVEVSAQTGQGIDTLLESILLQAEVMELNAAVDGMVQGVVVESALDRGRGPISTVLVQQGTLKKGDILLAGKEYGKVRSILDENGNLLEQAKPSVPVLVLGLTGMPEAGEEAIEAETERQAKEVAEFRQRKARDAKNRTLAQLISPDNFLGKIPNPDLTVLKLLLKTDVQGSLEALRGALENLSTDEAKIEVIAAGIGGITESDVGLASTSGAMIIGFNVRADARARKVLQGVKESVIIRYYSVIYEVVDEVRRFVEDMMLPEIREQIVGIAEVKEVFSSSKFGSVAGSQVIEGIVKRGSPIRVLRDDVVVYEGELESLRRFKDEVNEVVSGTECGIAVKNYDDVKVSDRIEAFERIEIKRTL